MIRIHRRKPVACVGDQLIQLSREEHLLLTALGMMDNKITPHELLLDAMFQNRVQISADRQLLWMKIYRLRKKLGGDWIRSQRAHGYMLVGDVQFYG